MLVLRDGARGMEVLLMRRPERDHDFRSGACVFPGGVLDRSDVDAHRLCIGLDDAAASRRLGLPSGGLDYFIAALRECFEEVGLLFVCADDGAAVELAPHAEALHQWRSRLHRGEARMGELCEAFGWRLDLRDMAYLAHWLTPVTRPKRFDTRFFVRLAPPGQQAMPDYGEALELMWLTPDEALDPQRGLKLLNVTQRTLHDMRSFANARAAFEHALALRGVALHFPRPALARHGPRFVIESDAAYDEVARLDPDGRGDVACELAPGDITQLSTRLWRIHGEAACTYVVTDLARSVAAVVDADANDPARWQALRGWDVAPVHHLLFTHAGDADLPALRAHWPQARTSAAAVAGQSVELGADSSLQAVAAEAGSLAFVLREESTLVGAAAHDALAMGAQGAEWLAPCQGFMRRLGRG